jgi:hypothetical protein
MKTIALPLPEIVGIASTRAMIAAGLVLLYGDHLAARQRHTLGTILTTIGLVSTVPFAWDLLRRWRQ